ncbi:MAG: lactate racemase domain-containing protein, partial [Actinomycetota bacterium]
MPRPGFVLEVDERTPSLLVHQGEGFRLQRFPLGSRVVYPPDSLPGIKDVNAAIRHALLNPIDAEPLPELLTPGMKLTIAIDDISLPLPPMTTPDIRQRIIEHIIELAAREGVEDVKLVVANALHRRMTADEIKRMVGERVFRSFWPNDLANFDAEDRDELTEIGVTDHQEVVEISKRAADSDLIVYVNINLVAMDGGHKSVAVGLASYRSLKHHHNVETMMHSRSYMDPRPGHSAINDSATRMGRLLAASGVKIFQIETTVNNDTFPSNLGFLNKREWEWSAYDQALMMTARKANDMAPPRVRRELYRRIEAPYKLTGINAGEVEAVHERTLENLHRQQLVEVQGQSDVLVFGLPYVCPY